MYLYNPKTSKYVSYNRPTRLVTPTVEAAQATKLTEEEATGLLARCTKKLKDFQCVQELVICENGTTQPLKKVKRRNSSQQNASAYTRVTVVFAVFAENSSRQTRPLSTISSRFQKAGPMHQKTSNVAAGAATC